MASSGDQEGMFPLSAGFAIFSTGSPMIVGIDHPLVDPRIDHWLYGEGHPCFKGDLEVVAVVGNLGRFMEFKSYAMANKLIDDRAAVFFGVVWDSIADFIKEDPRF